MGANRLHHTTKSTLSDYKPDRSTRGTVSLAVESYIDTLPVGTHITLQDVISAIDGMGVEGWDSSATTNKGRVRYPMNALTAEGRLLYLGRRGFRAISVWEVSPQTAVSQTATS